MTVNTNTTLVRPAIPSESSGIENLNKKAFPRDFICDWIFLSPVASRYISYAIKDSYFRRKYPEFFTAHFEGYLAGYFNIQTLTDRVHMNYLAVNPEFQKKGVAQKMLASLEEDCIYKLNLKKITLQVNKDNFAGLNFYKNAGFEVKNTVFLYLEDTNSLPLKKCSFEVENWLEAEAWQYTYGLSYLMLSIDCHDPIKIGRLGNDYWRINDVSYLQYEGLTYALRAIEPNRTKIFFRTDKILSIFPRILVTFWGMEKSL